MAIEKIPEIYFSNKNEKTDLFVHDFKMSKEVVKSKVVLSMNMFSFLLEGNKQVHFAGTAVKVSPDQSLLLKKGNWLWTELLGTHENYYCKLFFFSEEILNVFLEKHTKSKNFKPKNKPYFIIGNDAYITTYLKSLSTINGTEVILAESFLTVKFEELMLYLLQKYGNKFESFLYSLVSEKYSAFKQIVESKIHSNLKLEEIAFLCTMSLSTFKRHFDKEYHESPGKWLANQRLQAAKELLEAGNLKPSEIYSDFGYTSLSNFSNAFKKKFGFPPSETAA